MKKGACPTDLAFLDQASALPPTLFGGGLVFGSRAEHQAWSTCSFRLRIFRLTRRPQFLANARHNQSMRYQTHIAQESRGRTTEKLIKTLQIESRKILEKTSQSGPHPPGPHKILEKTSQSGPHPRDPENPRKNLTILRICLLVVGWLLVVPTSCAEGPCGGK